jgi:hypothetical protein
MPVPDFSPGEVLTAAAMDSIGLWLVKTVTIGSTVASVPVADAFSADYDNYLITVNGGAASTGNELRVQLGSTTSGYYYQLIYGAWANSALAEGNTNASNFPYTGMGTSSGLVMRCYLANPHRPTATRMSADYFGTTSNAGILVGLINNTTQYTGFTLVANTGTWTGGTIRVYGYRS